MNENQNTLSQKSKLFEAIVDNLPTSVFVKDEDLRIIYANRESVRRIGFPLSHILGKTDADLFPSEAAEMFMKRERRVMITGETDHTEDETTDRDGLRRIWATTKGRFTADDGINYLIGGQVDITRERKQPNRLKSAAEQSETIVDLLRALKILALNAAIEAARLGERGASFSILATEMRALAERTDGVAKNISKSVV